MKPAIGRFLGFGTGALLVIATGVVSPTISDSSDNQAHRVMPAGTVTLVSAWDDTPRLRFQVQCDYVVESKEAVDFEVHHVSCVVPDGGDSVRGVGVYLGYFPSLFSEAVKSGVLKLPGRVGSSKVTWYKWSERKDQRVVVHRETIVKGLFDAGPGNGSNDLENLFVHLWIWAPTDAEADALQGSVSGLQVVE